MVRLADSVAASQQALLDRTAQQLRILGGISPSGNNDSAACDKFLARQLEIFPAFDNLAFADANGAVTCSARSNTIPLPNWLKNWLKQLMNEPNLQRLLLQGSTDRFGSKVTVRKY